MDLSAWLHELKRRRVFRALLGWGLVAFAALQVAEPLMHALELPEWTLKVMVALLALGFPVTAALSWAYDLGATGLERTAPSELAPANPSRGRLALALVGLGLLVAAPGAAYLYDRTRPAADVARVPPGPPSIAVLAFADMSPGRDQEYLSDGIAEEIRGALSRVEGLRVAGRTSSLYFKGKNARLADIGRELNVGAVLEGSVRKDGTRLRITAQVVHVVDGYNVWSDTFDRDLRDIFAVQTEIAREVVGALKVRLLGAIESAIPRSPSTSPDAYLAYLMGRRLYARGSFEDMDRAIQAYERALALDPGYAPAWAALAVALFSHAEAKSDLREVLADKRRARAAADNAVAVGPNVASAYAARGSVSAFRRQAWDDAQSDLERAIALDPMDGEAHQQWGLVQAALGRLPEAVEALRRSTQLEPLDAFNWQRLGYLLTASGRYDEARDALRRALALAPDHALAAGYLAQTYLFEGRPADAMAVPELARAFEAWRLLTISAAQHDLGRRRESQAALDALVARHASGWAYNVAEACAWRGDADGALAWLARAEEQLDSGLAMVKYDPFFRRLRGDPRYAAFLRKLNLPPD